MRIRNRLVIFVARFIYRKSLYVSTKRNIISISRHEILADLGSELLDNVSNEMSKKEIVIYVGLHRRYGILNWLKGKKLGIQTEHFFDSDGKTLLNRVADKQNVISSVSKVDLILDLSVGNKILFEKIERTESCKIIFGPYIFDLKPGTYRIGETRKAIFVGSATERRSDIIHSLDRSKFDNLGRSVFGAELGDVLERYSGMLNIHSKEGIYTEAPRMLLSLKHGKVFVSELLSEEFLPDRHYVLVDDFNTRKDYKDIYENLANMTSEKFNFDQIIKKIVLINREKKEKI